MSNNIFVYTKYEEDLDCCDSGIIVKVFKNREDAIKQLNEDKKDFKEAIESIMNQNWDQVLTCESDDSYEDEIIFNAYIDQVRRIDLFIEEQEIIGGN